MNYETHHNITTVALSRYVTAVATGKLYDYRLMDRITDTDGNVLKTHNSSFSDVSDTLTSDQWDAVHRGMRMVCEELECFDHFDISVAGKTGTTNSNSDGWFMGYTPSLVSGCWVGGEDRDIHFASMQDGQGASMALPIWGYFMKLVYADKSLGYNPDEKFDVPKDFDSCDNKASAGGGLGIMDVFE